MSAELQVPADAVEDLNHHRYLMYPDTPADADDVRAIAAPVVAAELRRIYAAHWSNNTCCGHLIAELRARADELDGGA